MSTDLSDHRDLETALVSWIRRWWRSVVQSGRHQLLERKCLKQQTHICSDESVLFVFYHGGVSDVQSLNIQ